MSLLSLHFLIRLALFFAPILALLVKRIASFFKMMAGAAVIIPYTSKPFDDFSQHKMFKHLAAFNRLIITITLLNLWVTLYH